MTKREFRMNLLAVALFAAALAPNFDASAVAERASAAGAVAMVKKGVAYIQSWR